MVNYEELGKCKYEIKKDNENEYSVCGKPAIYKIWWGKKPTHCILVCQEHFNYIKEWERMRGSK